MCDTMLLDDLRAVPVYTRAYTCVLYVVCVCCLYMRAFVFFAPLGGAMTLTPCIIIGAHAVMLSSVNQWAPEFYAQPKHRFHYAYASMSSRYPLWSRISICFDA